ncbi:MAG: hypothetical protein ACK5MI_08675, partial [Mangrovibacterium sp.]
STGGEAIMNSLKVFKDDTSGKISTLELRGIYLNVTNDAIIDEDCIMILGYDDVNSQFLSDLTLGKNSKIEIKNSHNDGFFGGQNSTITVEGTLHAPQGFTIVAEASDNLKFEVGKFDGFIPTIVKADGTPSDAKWSDMLTETGL